MGNSVGTLGWVIRNWRIEVGERTHWVQLRHYTVTASYQIFVDGEEILNERKVTKLEPIPFEIEGTKGTVTPSLDSYSQITKGFKYECTYEGQKIPELVFDTQDPDPIRPHLKARLLPSAIIKKAGESKVVYYKLEVIDGDPLQKDSYVLKKRFSDFEQLDHLIRSSFSGHHLQSNLPPKPSKSMKIWTDHLEKRFVHQRRNELNKYLAKLFSLPKVCGNPDFAQFFAKPTDEDNFQVQDETEEAGSGAMQESKSNGGEPE
mmetsp:Transcript_10492/g.14573  ORF Transcript_10492/g.14573 Transcript_10492/m.14573 type:complete len:261 (+) Transcript_10492:222-1004(+)|eukprot:CAMPEP_0184481170 /NCGR_PEP_ID=MMETSP0113_2-20130426/2700_1 /TAXON_ID=91329 /ORGANISM="Norrisiella sphaerica, Strain BC52" /LENGTH=260 /DNA_ID=CAMNT_0026860109 /DNA_START=225 /DNA_END=1007 /DNA_ORIENTATION=-